MTPKQRKNIQLAMEMLENLPGCDVGPGGPTARELDALAAAGNVAEDNATYHTGQRVWWYLEAALK